MIRAIILTLVVTLAFEAVSAKKDKKPRGTCVDGALEGTDTVCKCPSGCSSCELKGKKATCTACSEGFYKKGSKCKTDVAPLTGTCNGGKLAGGKEKCKCSNKDCQSCEVSIGGDGQVVDVCTACKKNRFMIEGKCTSKCQGDGLFKVGSKKTGAICTKAFTCTDGAKEGGEAKCKCYDSKCGSCKVSGSGKKDQECLMCKDDTFEVQQGSCKKSKDAKPAKEPKNETKEGGDDTEDGEEQSPSKIKPTKEPKKSKEPKSETKDEGSDTEDGEEQSPLKEKATKSPEDGEEQSPLKEKATKSPKGETPTGGADVKPEKPTKSPKKGKKGPK